ncbi:MAG: hypothetical protein IJI45_01830 [Anaerolineaceae bacterium]|nr:hypothetical protein [Anaerolineaceae bacterium]
MPEKVGAYDIIFDNSIQRISLCMGIHKRINYEILSIVVHPFSHNLKEYNACCNALVNRYEETEQKHDTAIKQIDQIMVRRRKIERFIESIKDLPELITEFDASLWAALVDSMTVYAKDRITFRLTCGMEIEI